MITVIVPNSENETLIKEICCILEKFGGACFVSQNSVQDFFAVSPSFLFFLTDTVCTVPSKNTVLLHTDTDADIKLPKNCRFERIITDYTENKIQKSKVISVGMRRQNDISISSTESGNMHIAVQNTVYTLSGKEILPCEFSVLGNTTAQHNAILYAFTLLLLAEKTDTETLIIKL